MFNCDTLSGHCGSSTYLCGRLWKFLDWLIDWLPATDIFMQLLTVNLSPPKCFPDQDFWQFRCYSCHMTNIKYNLMLSSFECQLALGRATSYGSTQFLVEKVRFSVSLQSLCIVLTTWTQAITILADMVIVMCKLLAVASRGLSTGWLQLPAAKVKVKIKVRLSPVYETWQSSY